MSHRAVADGLAVHLGRLERTLKMNFTEPGTFGFSGFQRANGPCLGTGRSELGPGRCSSFFGQSVVEMWFYRK
jgi:hypothetical protein